MPERSIRTRDDEQSRESLLTAERADWLKTGARQPIAERRLLVSPYSSLQRFVWIVRFCKASNSTDNLRYFIVLLFL